MCLVKTENLSIQYTQQSILEAVNFSVQPGEKVVITGESGTGKTTLLNSLLGFVLPSSGHIQFMQQPITQETIHQLRHETAFLPQELIFTAGKVKDIFLEPFTFKKNKASTPSEEQIAQTFAFLNLHYTTYEKNFEELSGGQKQRVLLASIFLLNKRLIILDEPTKGLDDKTVHKVMELFLQDQSKTIIASSHHPEWIKRSDQEIKIEHYAPNS